MFLKAKQAGAEAPPCPGRPGPSPEPASGDCAAGLLFSGAGCPHWDGLRLSSLIFALET